MSIVIVNRQRTRKVNLRLLKQIAKELLAELETENPEFGINLVGAREMAALNWKFLQHEGPTDVITFDYSEKQKAENKKEKCLCGEIFVCVDEALLQAKAFGTNWQSEVVRYIIHGILHLLGYEDARADLRRKMKHEEHRRLRRLSRKFSLAKIAGASKITA